MIATITIPTMIIAIAATGTPEDGRRLAMWSNMKSPSW